MKEFSIRSVPFFVLVSQEYLFDMVFLRGRKWTKVLREIEVVKQPITKRRRQWKKRYLGLYRRSHRCLRASDASSGSLISMAPPIWIIEAPFLSVPILAVACRSTHSHVLHGRIICIDKSVCFSSRHDPASTEYEAFGRIFSKGNLKNEGCESSHWKIAH